jgi:hypothetical protein
MKNPKLFELTIISMLFGGYACMPAHLKKYHKPTEQVSTTTSDDSAFIGKDEDESASDREGKKLAESGRSGRATIYAVSGDTYRIDLSHEIVWSSLVNVLLKNYNLVLVDRGLGVMTTEWDSYYLEEALFRNKISLRLMNLGGGSSELTIHNNIEQASTSLAGLWLPADDDLSESHRIVKNLALALRQPEPSLSAGPVAKSTR